MRTWQRSAIACTGSSPTGGDADARGEDRRHRVRFGGHVQDGEGHVSHRCVTGATTLLRVAIGREEFVDVLAGVLSAVEAAPQHPQPADELVAGVDRHQIADRAARSRRRAPVPAAPRCRRRACPPGGRRRGCRSTRRDPVRIRWRRPGRDRTPPCGPSAELRKKNASPTGICSASHRRRSSAKSGEREVAVGDGAVAQLGVGVGEQQIAAAAHAHQLAAFDIHHMLVLVGDRLRTHLAAFAARPAGAPRLARMRASTSIGAPSIIATPSGTAIDSTPSRTSTGIGSR